MLISYSTLIKLQIESLEKEILLVNFVFSLLNVLSLLALGFLFGNLLENALDKSELFIEFLKVAVALITPFVNVVAQGFYHPKWRKLNVLRHLWAKELLQEKFDTEEIKIIYEK